MVLKKLLVPEKFLVQKNFLVQIICGRQNIWGDKKILVEHVEVWYGFVCPC